MTKAVSIVSLHYPPDTTGIAPYAGGLAAGLHARDHDVTSVVAHPFYPEWRIRPGYGQWTRREVVEGVTVHRVLHYVPRPPRGLRRLISEITFGLRLLFSRLGSDSVVIAVSPALFATALVALRVRLTPSRPSLMVWVQDLYTLGMSETKEGGRLSTAIARHVEGMTLRAADRVVAIHPRFARYVADVLDVDPDRVAVIRNWTHLRPTPLIDQDEARRALGWPTDVRLIVHTGNMGAKQGLDNVVRAARLADEGDVPVLFILVGEGSERERLQRDSAGIERIRFVEPLDDAAYRLALAAADCLLVNELPGVAAMAAPSKLTSYFDAARPVLAATDPGGITAEEVARACAGIAVHAGDPAALLDAAVAMADDVDAAASYGAAGRRYCQENLTADAALTAFEKLIQEVASERIDRLRR